MKWPWTKTTAPTIDRDAFASKLAELHPRPAVLPPVAGERLVQTSADFAEIVLLYALARGHSLASPESLREAAQRVSLWYYGLEPQ